jgi:hypothetical protein
MAFRFFLEETILLATTEGRKKNRAPYSFHPLGTTNDKSFY